MAPQLIKILKDRDAENVSILTLCVLLAGLSLWIWYGVLVKDLIIIISNSFSVLLNMVLLFCAFRFK
jgi:MtN3 and saliva related transmembrane protein